jgi:hypothetical protein
MKDVERVTISKLEGIDPDLFKHEFLLKNRPVIFRDQAYGLSPLSRWDQKYFCEKWGDFKVPVQVYPPGKHHLPHHKTDRHFKTIKVREFFSHESEKNADGESFLLGKLSVDLFPDMEQEYTLPKLVNLRCFAKKVWIYGKGGITALHFDVVDTFLVQGKGAKKVYFFEPDTLNLYPFSFFSQAPHFSQVVAAQMDVKKFPRLSKVKIYEGVLEEGEVLYIPFGWWHEMHGLGEMNYGLAFWHYSPLWKNFRYPLQALRLWNIAIQRRLKNYPI